MLSSCRSVLRMNGYRNVETEQDGNEGLRRIMETPPDLLVLDLCLPDCEGERLLEEASVRCPGMPVLVVTGLQDTASVVRCMKKGAYDYLVKPLDATRFMTTIQHAVDYRMLNIALREQSRGEQKSVLRHPEAFADIITQDRQLQSLMGYVESVAGSSFPVLICGETGTGKELFARAVHEVSRPDGAFVALNVSGVDDETLSDTLFGHAKGAYTGASTRRAGLVERAAGGTLFLDEIGDLSGRGQLKLLRLIQEKEYYPLGADHPRHQDILLITATNRDLEQACAAGRFREDLYYRLTTHRITLPPLRKRQGDVPLLFDHFVRKHGVGTPRCRFAALGPREQRSWQTYTYPGNVRELESLVVDQCCAGGGCFGGFPVQEAACAAEFMQTGVKLNFHQVGVLPAMKQLKEALIREALERTAGNQSQAARLIGISQQAISQYVCRLKNETG